MDGNLISILLLLAPYPDSSLSIIQFKELGTLERLFFLIL